MKRAFFILLCALTVCLAAQPLAPARAGGLNYDKQYEVAVGLLYNPLDSRSISQANTMLGELGNYEFARQYKFYSDAIIALSAEAADGVATAKTILSVVSTDKGFAEDLAGRKLPACGEFLMYAEGRLAESAEDWAKAVDCYRQSNVLDALDRAVRLMPMVPAQTAAEPSEPTAGPEALSTQAPLPVVPVRSQLAGIKKSSVFAGLRTPQEIFNDHPDQLYMPEKAEYPSAMLNIHTMYLSVVYQNVSGKAASAEFSVTLTCDTGDFSSAAETVNLPKDDTARMLCFSLDNLLEKVRSKAGGIPAGLYRVDVYVNGVIFTSDSFYVV